MTGTQQEYDEIQSAIKNKPTQLGRIKEIIELHANGYSFDTRATIEMTELLQWAFLKIEILAHALDIARAQLNKHDSATDEDIELFTEALRNV
jgi:hypothetical protein